MPLWQAVVFDLDDTLYPERDYVLGGFRSAAAWMEEQVGLPREEGFAALSKLFTEGVRGRIFDEWLQAADLPLDWVPSLVSIYRDHRPELRPFDGVVELLRSLKNRCSIGLVSDGHLAVQRRKFAALRLDEFFQAVVFSDEWGADAWKPSEVPFREVLGRLGVASGAAVYVGDNPTKDFFGARAHGMATIWSRHSRGEYCLRDCPSPAHAADFTVDTLGELGSLLKATVVGGQSGGSEGSLVEALRRGGIAAGGRPAGDGPGSREAENAPAYE